MEAYRVSKGAIMLEGQVMTPLNEAMITKCIEVRVCKERKTRR